MADLIASICATHHPNWADVEALLNILLTVDERWLVINKANRESQCLHQENPSGTPQPSWGNSLDRAGLVSNWWGPSLPGTLQKVHTGRA